MCEGGGWGQGVVYYESIKRELQRRLIYEYRSDERLKTKFEESTRLEDTRRVSILVLGSNLKKWNKNWNKFEL